MRILIAVSQTIVFLLCCMVTIFTFFLPQFTTVAALNSLNYAVQTVLPSLFPFIVIAALLSKGRFMTVLGLPFYLYTRYVLKIHSYTAGAVITLAMIGGFAAGAVALKNVVADGEISQKEAQRLMPVIMMPSVPFIYVVVGGMLYESYTLGIILCGAVIAATLAVGALFSVGAKTEPNTRRESTAPPLSRHIVSSVRDSSQSMLYICGFVIIFGILSQLISVLLPETLALYSSVLFEFSTACAATAKAGNIYATATALSFCGLCAFFQVEVIMGGCLSTERALLSRFFHLPIMLVVVKLLMTLFPRTVTAVYMSGSTPVVLTKFGIEMSVFALLTVVAFFTELSKQKTTNFGFITHIGQPYTNIMNFAKESVYNS